MSDIGLRTIEGLQVLPLDGLWQAIRGVDDEQKIGAALQYAGCEFHDDARRLVASHVVALTGIGGVPVAYQAESDETIQSRIQTFVDGTRLTMASSAGFSYLNNGERDMADLYTTVTGLGHLSIAHTVQANVVVAGITEATELELSLQRDLVHLSKITNTRTKIQNAPPIVVRHPANAGRVLEMYEYLKATTTELRVNSSPDTLEDINGMFPVNKATLLMISGDVSNLRKLSLFRDDRGKERELRDVADSMHQLLSLVWPEIMKGKRS